MARVVNGWHDLASDDDLLEITLPPTPPARPTTIDSLLDPPPTLIPIGMGSSRLPRGSPRRPSLADRTPTPYAAPPRQPTAVIDLTDEPDSPVQQRPPPPHGRNPRRTQPHRPSPPRLARSDSTFMNPLASVIDLTADSPDDGEPARPFRARNLHHHQRQQQQQQQQQQPQQRPPNQQRPPPPHRMHHPFSPDQLIELEIMNRGMSFFPALSASARRVQRIAGSLGFIGADVWRGGQQLDFLGSLGSPREPSPKPPMEEVPPTRDGFTRDTNAGPNDDDESVVVCPACNEELAYDPAGAAPAHGAAPTGRKRKRAAGEHHFWALKKCGHVYCADCFENRRPTKAAPNGAGFRNPSGKPPLGAPNDLRCVVDGCESKVATKTEWVGIFL